jgi:hypothetical protein
MLKYARSSTFTNSITKYGNENGPKESLVPESALSLLVGTYGNFKETPNGFELEIKNEIGQIWREV